MILSAIGRESMTATPAATVEMPGLTRRAAIFDLDGTLVDSLDDIATALNGALAALGGPTAPHDVVRHWIGDGLPELCRRALPGADEAAIHALIDAARRRYRGHSLDRTRPYAGIKPLLGRLRDRAVPMAVLSNKPHDLTLDILRGLGLDAFFDVVRGLREESDRKPAPGPALEIARHLGRPPGEIYLIGDGPTDVGAARAAGMIAVGVSWGFRGVEELRAAGAELIVDRPEEIAALKGL
jgi:phosphoglycolate phosphatase